MKRRDWFNIYMNEPQTLPYLAQANTILSTLPGLLPPVIKLRNPEVALQGQSSLHFCRGKSSERRGVALSSAGAALVHSEGSVLTCSQTLWMPSMNRRKHAEDISANTTTSRRWDRGEGDPLFPESRLGSNSLYPCTALELPSSAGAHTHTKSFPPLVCLQWQVDEPWGDFQPQPPSLSVSVL